MTESAMGTRLAVSATAWLLRAVWGRIVADSKSTPGPWEAWPSNDQHPAMVATARQEGDTREARLVTVIAGLNHGRLPDSEVEANARLIASAPALLEACKEMDSLLQALCTVAYRTEVEDYLPYGLKEKVVAWVKSTKARAAIKLAEGQQ